MNSDLIQLRTATWPKQQTLFESMLANELKMSSSGMVDAVKQQVLSGGKRIRATIPPYVHRYLSTHPNNPTSGYPETTSLWLGLATELMHAATLCHDDILDEDRVRHNAPTTWVTHGIQQALFVGDLLIFLSQEAVESSGLSEKDGMTALGYLSRSVKRVIYGQSLEIELRQNSQLPTPQTYKEVVAGKTGGLFSLGLVLGGIASSLSQIQISSLEQLGMDLGEIFQIQDDIIDLIGDKGKGSSTADLWESKPSWLMLQAVQHLEQELKEELLKLLFLPKHQKKSTDIDRILALLEQSGALFAGREYVNNLPETGNRLKQSYPDWVGLIDPILEMIQAPIISRGFKASSTKAA
jgi:geranylgeranyl pyrophosphate synthase